MTIAFVTYEVEPVYKMIEKVSSLHNKIELILEEAGYFNKEYSTPTMAIYRKFKDSIDELFNIDRIKLKFDLPQITKFNNDLTKFMIALANSLKFCENPISISIDIELVEYITFLTLYSGE